jgi:hypothetical protein
LPWLPFAFLISWRFAGASVTADSTEPSITMQHAGTPALRRPCTQCMESSPSPGFEFNRYHSITLVRHDSSVHEAKGKRLRTETLKRVTSGTVECQRLSRVLFHMTQWDAFLRLCCATLKDSSESHTFARGAKGSLLVSFSAHMRWYLPQTSTRSRTFLWTGRRCTLRKLSQVPEDKTG